MPNPKGNPDSLKPFTTKRDEALTERIAIRVTKSMADEIKSIEDYPDFCRQALQDALNKKNTPD